MSVGYTQNQRRKVFDHYGWACACCGSPDRPSIDHIEGGGRQHRDSLGIGRSAGQTYTWLVQNDFPDGFQTLCKPCNSSKGPRAACSLDHSSGIPRAMTSAERARRWRQLASHSRSWGTCTSCGERQRLRNSGLVETHGDCLGGGRFPRAGCVRGLGWPRITNLGDLLDGDTDGQ